MINTSFIFEGGGATASSDRGLPLPKKHDIELLDEADADLEVIEKQMI